MDIRPLDAFWVLEVSEVVPAAHSRNHLSSEHKSGPPPAGIFSGVEEGLAAVLLLDQLNGVESLYCSSSFRVYSETAASMNEVIVVCPVWPIVCIHAALARSSSTGS